MSMKWWTAYSYPSDRKGAWRGSKRKLASAFAVLSLSAALAGCSLLPDEPEEEDLSAIQLPQISKKPEYEVTTKTLETKVQGTGKIMSEEEKTLYYTSSSLEGKRLKTLYISNGDAVKAGQVIAELDVEDLKKSLRSQKLQFRKLELDMKNTLRQKDEMDPLEFEQKQIEFEEARQAITDMEQDIAAAVLTAPFGGTVVSVSAEEGKQIKAYDPIAVVADTSRLVVAAKLSSDNLAKVAVGMEVKVSINNVGELTGKIKALPEPSNDQENPGEAQIDKVSNYLLVDVPDLPAKATRGTPLTASVVTNRKENAVVIPTSALRTIGARTYVQVVEADGSKREVDIEVGQQTSTDVEVLQGLTPGQKVVGR